MISCRYIPANNDVSGLAFSLPLLLSTWMALSTLARRTGSDRHKRRQQSFNSIIDKMSLAGRYLEKIGFTLVIQYVRDAKSWEINGFDPFNYLKIWQDISVGNELRRSSFFAKDDRFLSTQAMKLLMQNNDVIAKIGSILHGVETATDRDPHVGRVFIDLSQMEKAGKHRPIENGYLLTNESILLVLTLKHR